MMICKLLFLHYGNRTSAQIGTINLSESKYMFIQCIQFIICIIKEACLFYRHLKTCSFGYFMIIDPLFNVFILFVSYFVFVVFHFVFGHST